MSGFETIIGLEVHCQLNTKTKIFAGVRQVLVKSQINMSARLALRCQVRCLY